MRKVALVGLMICLAVILWGGMVGMSEAAGAPATDGVADAIPFDPQADWTDRNVCVALAEGKLDCFTSKADMLAAGYDLSPKGAGCDVGSNFVYLYDLGVGSAFRQFNTTGVWIDLGDFRNKATTYANQTPCQVYMQDIEPEPDMYTILMPNITFNLKWFGWNNRADKIYLVP